VSKKAPSGKDILKDVSISFYPGAKIGVVGLNGAGKSTLLRIMSGEDQEIDGQARPLPSASIGFLKQEPELDGETVADAIEPALAKARHTLEQFGELSAKLGARRRKGTICRRRQETQVVYQRFSFHSSGLTSAHVYHFCSSPPHHKKKATT
jgi:ATPase subunit of ABC transporter with duplicated ATPase domains